MLRSITVALAAVVSIASLPAHSAIITYEVVDLGGSNYRYEYTVSNDASVTNSIGLFDILFDPALYAEASLVNVSDLALETNWSQMFLGSGIGVPAAFDVFATTGDIGPGSSVDGFAVQFSWLGLGLPGSQGFEIYDPETFDLLGVGTTTPRPSTPVPEPGPLTLTLAGLLMLATLRSQSRTERLKRA
jgi:hypothetical protein